RHHRALRVGGCDRNRASGSLRQRRRTQNAEQSERQYSQLSHQSPPEHQLHACEYIVERQIRTAGLRLQPLSTSGSSTVSLEMQGPTFCWQCSVPIRSRTLYAKVATAVSGRFHKVCPAAA